MTLILDPDQVTGVTNEIDNHRQEIFNLMSKYKSSNLASDSFWRGKSQVQNVTTATDITVKQAKIDSVAQGIVHQLRNTVTSWQHEDSQHAAQQAGVAG
ncbi:Uncharacterised protein [Mycobacteroides abscessus subsp. abscessus]|uniref:WXG100 family type VII secretion target n=1 Tax=Mycobacteroides chelonae TaxID=1774 RepID=A0A1S1M087_MYCCH|nr:MULTISPECIES: hypothetical protein [Mycobacteroides]OHU76107.1 hypothetical protein BKG84_24755 [Mycobacteroides chelonae]SLL30419.1 Uncharacterised protein [Mycobacteroides abscessus subsp. abscessus]